ncbi:tryptophan halogenase family protein [Paucibacter sp. Y2R2-4]|uniref:tryptophan halogenase family protein n=1 Tax=Paucibacter sp. Y2R2-4 TaxID=2893553 RepID=UPI0021E43A94|nr:tryptophan halogenase family protein [Paucibacter sp. Y2R2-4]MCV2351041.1 tryptophan 7-halogenase [Paucibacter sp. Y2R2-4]
MRVKRIAIIGGGTAGWLAANHLAVELRAEQDVTITVIESPEIGIIGVGEGTVPHIRKSLMKFGISEADLLASCDTTFKVGIKFVDWMAPNALGHSNYYYHPFASPYPAGIDTTSLYLQQAQAMEFAAVTEVPGLADAMKSPKEIASAPFEGPVNYAYHFNAVKFGQLLAKNAKERLRVQHQQATVLEACLNEQGEVDYLLTQEGEKLYFDFYVDCSGFHSLLLGKRLQVPFVDKSDQILTDSALAVQIPTEAGAEIPPYTLAKAHQAGWLWDIPLTNRRGVGFVYASAHMTEAQALQGLAAHVGVPADSLSPRKIPMKIGYREKFWCKNVVALGLAQGFVEPLEATSIFVTDLAAELFARNFSLEKEGMSAASAYCNKVVAYTWERVMDFVQLHYCISDRRDSEFWRLSTLQPKLSEVLAERLAMWKFNAPKKSDFFSRFDLFDVENFLFVLYGMKYKTLEKGMTGAELQVFKQELQNVKNLEKSLSQKLMGHREWLDGFKSAYQSMQRA